MNLICDLCGASLTQTDAQSAKCANCGLEYGAERLQEMRQAAAMQEQKVIPQEQPKLPETPIPEAPIPENPEAPETPTQEPEAEKAPEKKKSGCGIWTLLLVAGLDLAIGTHGIVAIFCIIILIIVLCAKKK